MPEYTYRCSNCEYEFQEIHSHKKTLRTCPECSEKSLDRLLHAPLLIKDNAPKTLGTQAEKNSKESSYVIDKKRHDQKKQYIERKQKAREKLKEKFPNAKFPEKKKEPWYGKLPKKMENADNDKIKKYIYDGE